MSAPSAVDDRTFETGTELTTEEVADNRAYFEETGRAYNATVVDGEGSAAPQSSAPTEVAPAPGTDSPNGTAAPPAEEVPVDAETQAEWNQLKSDGEKLGYNARRTKKIKELSAAVDAEKVRLEERDKRIKELEERLAKAPATPDSLTATQPSMAAATPPVQTEAPPPIKAKEFDKPRPVRPKLEDFADEIDPAGALATKGVIYAEELQEWKDEKRDFDDEQKVLVRQQEQEREQAQSRETTRKMAIDKKFEDVRRDFPDFDAKVNPVYFTPTLKYLLLDKLPDGLHLGYELAKPENAEVLRSLVGATSEVQDAVKIEDQIINGAAELAIFRKSLKDKGTNGTPATPVVATPPEQTPSNATPPRREESAPLPVRGRQAGPAIRLEDIPVEDYDTRRKWREANGQL